MAGDSSLQFNDAVRECLASCYRTDLPVAALAEYVEVLKQRDWTPAEIHKVEAAVLKILLAVVTKDERADLVNRMIKPRGDSLAPAPAKAAAVESGAPSHIRRNASDQARKNASGNVLSPSEGFGSCSSLAKGS